MAGYNGVFGFEFEVNWDTESIGVDLDSESLLDDYFGVMFF
jgi:hypothetical protein